MDNNNAIKCLLIIVTTLFIIALSPIGDLSISDLVEMLEGVD